MIDYGQILFFTIYIRNKKVKLRGIEFGNVLAASGVQGFFGEDYWFHKLTRPNFSGVTFVSKTATVSPRPGNLDNPRNVFRKLFPS